MASLLKASNQTSHQRTGGCTSVHLLHFVHLGALIRRAHPRSQEQVFNQLEPYVGGPPVPAGF